jgi:hypothetical protein
MICCGSRKRLALDDGPAAQPRDFHNGFSLQDSHVEWSKKDEWVKCNAMLARARWNNDHRLHHEPWVYVIGLLGRDGSRAPTPD